MTEDKTSISKAASYQEVGEFWSKRDLADFWGETEPVDFEIEMESERRYYPLERDLSNELNKIARRRGVSTVTMLNLWIKEKLVDSVGDEPSAHKT